METAGYDDALSAFFSATPPVRHRLRMLGSAAGAEDIVQDVWVRWQSTNRSAVRDPGVVRAAQKLVSGRERVTKLIAAVFTHFWNGVTLSWIEANGTPKLRHSQLAHLAGVTRPRF